MAWYPLAITALVFGIVFLSERELRLGSLFVREKTMRLLAFCLLGSLVVMLLDFVLHRRVILASVVLGSALMLAGAIVRIVSRIQLAENFTYQVRAPKRLVTSGIYASIRHPMYVAIFLLWLGAGYALGSFYGIVLAFAAVLPAILLRVRHEESLLRGTFGKEYNRWASRTSRFLPRFS